MMTAQISKTDKIESKDSKNRKKKQHPHLTPQFPAVKSKDIEDLPLQVVFRSR